MKALCLAGGGAKAPVILGAYNALMQSGYQFDMLHGTSAGALIAASVHAGRYNQLVNVLSTITNRKVFSPAPWLVFTSSASLLSSRPLAKIIAGIDAYAGLQNNPIPCYVTATNTSTLSSDTRRLPLSTPDLTNKFILASASFPVGLPTIAMPSQDGKSIVRLMDGGCMLNYGVLWAISMGCDEVDLIIPSTAIGKPIKNLLDVLDVVAASAGQTQFVDETLAAKLIHQSNKNVTLNVYGPEVPVPIGTLDFNAAGKHFNQLFILGQRMMSKPLLQVRHKIAPTVCE
jgi:predicted acylesterase/phospholipase RssA